MNQQLQQQLQRFEQLEGKDAQTLSAADKQVATELRAAISQKLLDMGAHQQNYRMVRRRDGQMQYVAYSVNDGLREWAMGADWHEMSLATMVDVVRDLLTNY